MIGKSLKNRYFIISLIQEGGMSYVYLAEDVINKKNVAVKIMKDETFSDPLNIARFQREARACAALRHNNIVEIYDIDEYKGKPYNNRNFDHHGYCFWTYCRFIEFFGAVVIKY